MTNENYVSGYTDERSVKPGRKQQMPVGQLHASEDGVTSLCEGKPLLAQAIRPLDTPGIGSKCPNCRNELRVRDMHW